MKKIIMAVLLLISTKSIACGSIGANIEKSNDDWIFYSSTCVKEIAVGSGGIQIIYIDPAYQVLAGASISASDLAVDLSNGPGNSTIQLRKRGTRQFIDPSDVANGTIIYFGKNVPDKKENSPSPKQEARTYKEPSHSKN